MVSLSKKLFDIRYAFSFEIQTSEIKLKNSLSTQLRGLVNITFKRKKLENLQTHLHHTTTTFFKIVVLLTCFLAYWKNRTPEKNRTLTLREKPDPEPYNRHIRTNYVHIWSLRIMRDLWEIILPRKVRLAIYLEKNNYKGLIRTSKDCKGL